MRSVSSAGRVDPRVWLLALGTFATGTDLFIVSGLLPAVGRDLHLSTALAGQTSTAFAATYAVGAPILAGLTARFRRKPLLIAVMLVFGLGNALSAVSANFTVLLISRVITGAGAALYSANASAVAARISPPEVRGRALAIVYAGMTSAIAFGVPIGNWIGELSSWRWAFGLVTFLAALTVAGIQFFLPDVPTGPGATVRERMAAIRIPQAPTHLLVTALWTAGTFTVYTYLGSILEQITGLSAGQQSWVLLLFGVGSFGGVFVGGRLADRFGSVVGLTLTISALGIWLVVLTPAIRWPLAAAVAVGVWGLVHWPSFPLLLHRALGIGGDRGDMLLALNNSAVYVGQMAAAAVGGLLANGDMLRWNPLAGAGFEALAGLALVVSVGALRGRGRKRPLPAAAPTEAEESRPALRG
ncbi:MFS transporter [Streptomyces sp. NPDC047022]|uniref:MFS transporter n=1 Tax=Streptomyces sp. NPDC047022 TaxID=3155737 RepID=UPI0033FE7AB1